MNIFDELLDGCASPHSPVLTEYFYLHAGRFLKDNLKRAEFFLGETEFCRYKECYKEIESSFTDGKIPEDFYLADLILKGLTGEYGYLKAEILYCGFICPMMIIRKRREMQNI